MSLVVVGHGIESEAGLLFLHIPTLLLILWAAMTQLMKMTPGQYSLNIFVTQPDFPREHFKNGSCLVTCNTFCAYIFNSAQCYIKRNVLTIWNKIEVLDSPKCWTLNQCNKTAEPKADKYHTAHFSPFSRCLNVLKKGRTPKICMLCFVIINSILFNHPCLDQCCLATYCWGCLVPFTLSVFTLSVFTRLTLLLTGWWGCCRSSASQQRRWRCCPRSTKSPERRGEHLPMPYTSAVSW